MDKTATKYGKQVVRKNRELKWVRLGSMRVSPRAQREFKQYHADELLANFDLDEIGTPEVSYRDGHYFITDGQHRIDALKRWLGDGWEDQNVQCWVASGLTESDEAEAFLKLNNKLGINAFQKFKVALVAKRPVETEINGVVEGQGLCVSSQKVPNSVAAVGTLRKIYARDGKDCLGRALRIARDAYGDAGLEALVLDGFGLLCGRYNGTLNERTAVDCLQRAHGGVSGLLGLAEQLKQKTGNTKGVCVAAAAVQIINRGRGGKKLADWWKS